MATFDSRASIEIHADGITQLFDTLDPSPYLQRYLAETTEDFIVSSARELPRNRPIDIIVHLPPGEATAQSAQQIGDAFARHFRYRVDRLAYDLRELFRIGRWSLLIGMAVLAGCLILNNLLAGLSGKSYLARFFTEGLIILGWVANWRPMEIYLYEWWPLVRQQRLYRRLSIARVEVRPDAAESNETVRSMSESRG
jgi:hypothetical protein